MALVKTSPIVSDLRGSIGGVTFTRARQGLVARRRVKPTEPRTQAATFARTNFSASLDHWRFDLLEEHRQAWRDAASAITLRNSLGDTYTPSGMTMFLRACSLSATIVTGIPYTPPSPLICPIPSLYLEFDDAFDVVYVKSVTNQNPTFTGYGFWWQTQNLPPSVYFPRGPWTFGNSFPIIADDPVASSIVQYQIRFRPNRRFFRIVVFTLALSVSMPFILSVDVPP